MTASTALTARQLLDASAALLLDFDGPMCSVFAGYPAPDAAADLRQSAKTAGLSIPPGAHDTNDPLTVLAILTEANPDAADTIEAQLRELEATAVQSATPTPGLEELLKQYTSTGRPIAVVSNNSAHAVNLYLTANGLASFVTSVHGRPAGRPDRMKPHPHLLVAAAQNLRLPERACLFIGDSVTDVQAARAAGTAVIGYANKPGKSALLADAGTNAMVTTLNQLTE